MEHTYIQGTSVDSVVTNLSVGDKSIKVSIAWVHARNPLFYACITPRGSSTGYWELLLEGKSAEAIKEVLEQQFQIGYELYLDHEKEQLCQELTNATHDAIMELLDVAKEKAAAP